MAEPVFFDARVVYKVATEAEWNNIVLDTLIKGEFYFYVVEGDPNTVINIKVGDGVRQPKDLPFFWDASIRVPFFGTATPSSTPSPATGSGFWIATEAGTYTNYGGVVLPANSLGIITRIGTSYSIVTVSFDFSDFLKLTDSPQLFDSSVEKVPYSESIDLSEDVIILGAYLDTNGNLVDFFFQAEDGIRAFHVTGVQTCALPIYVLGVEHAVAIVEMVHVVGAETVKAMDRG